MLLTGPHQVSLKQQIRINSKIFGNIQCRDNEGTLYLSHAENVFTDFLGISAPDLLFMTVYNNAW